MTVLVAGSRTFGDYARLVAVLDAVRAEVGDFRIIHGGAVGADCLAELWAARNAVPTTIYRPDWNKHGKAAGPIRNREMVEAADRVIVFWDGESRGTRSTVDYARRAGKPLEVHTFDAHTLPTHLSPMGTAIEQSEDADNAI